MRFLTYSDLKVPRRLSASFEKVRSAIERDEFRSADVKKLVDQNALFRARARLRQPADRAVRPLRR
ncbi:MAG: hypothetical protein BGO98_11065 [Myxococcales bacterium 68-20]|nr:hypothetical protein [Myxococcales bacterium]OJY16732.1 MAG: hypothetical protein BGO98_11065 [Myxococcales bacterium 68-20]